jgi:hypothetical protein
MGKWRSNALKKGVYKKLRYKCNQRISLCIRILATGLIVVLLLCSCTTYEINSNKTEDKYVTEDNEIIYKEYQNFEFGEEEGFIGGVSNDNAESSGPKSFAVSCDGSVYFLDTQKYRISRYSTEGVFLWSVALPSDCYGLDMEATDDALYLVCESGSLYCMQIDAAVGDKIEFWQEIGHVSRTNFAGLYSESGIVYCRMWNGSDLRLTIGQMVEKTDETLIERDDDSNKVMLSKAGITYNVSYVAEPIGIYIIKTIDDSTYIIEHEALLDNYPFAETRIGKYDSDGKLATALPISTKSYNYLLPFKKLYVTDDGDVYQMVPTKSGVAIFIVPWFSGEKTRITEAMLEENKLTQTEKQ